MKILFITDLYPVSNSEKTTPKTLVSFVEEWRKQGHTVDIIKPNFILNSFIRRKPFYKTQKYNDIINVNYWTPFWFDVKNKLKKFKIDFKSYDAIIAHMPSGILFADKLGLPFTAGVHNSDLDVLTKPFYKLTNFSKRERKALINAQKIACRSYVIKDKLLKMFPEFKNKMFLCLSGVDCPLSPALPLEGGGSMKLLTCAHLKKRKNIDKLILACKDTEGVELTVIGDGKLRKSLEKLDKNVKFTGYLEHDKVLEEMRNSDIFILPSVGETFGMVYLEAMSQGCITVCTKDDGISGVIKHGENGYLTEPDLQSIRELLSDIISTDMETLNTLRNKALETVKELTPEKCAENYLQQIFKIS